VQYVPLHSSSQPVLEDILYSALSPSIVLRYVGFARQRRVKVKRYADISAGGWHMQEAKHGIHAALCTPEKGETSTPRQFIA